ncbi:MAG: hypothetical protein DVB31_01195 [Verrucomicrobia bacterium]|nr:MAG: hypothetical protein DVB31_01195 [Verrucomicrobiota bacterium]
MIGTIRRHSAILWWIVVVAVIVSFVAWFAPNQPAYRSMLGSGNAGDRGTIYGRPIKADDVRAAARRVRIMAGNRQIAQDVETQQIYQQLLLDEKFRQFGIVVSDQQLAEFIKQVLRDPSTGELLYDREVEFRKTQGVSEAEYLEFVRRQLAERHLRDVVEIPAQLVTPREAEAEVRRANEQILATAVLFSSSNHAAGVQMTPDALGRFFTNRVAAYRTPEKIIASYVKFGATNHLAEAEAAVAKMPDLTSRLEGVYTQRGAEAFRDAEGKPLAKDAAIARLREDFVRSRAVAIAGDIANDFYNDLGKIEPVTARNLDTVASKRGIKVEITQPFSGTDRPFGLESLRGLADQLARLDPAVPFTEPIAAGDGVYIVAIRQRIPSITPPFETVRNRVADDYRRTQSLEAARTAGQAFHNLATNALASGKAFSALVAEQKLAAIDLPPITQQMNMVPGLPPQVDLNSVKDAAFGLQPGQVSGLILGRDGGYVVYLRERKAAAEDLVKAEIPKISSEMRQREERAGYSEWLNHEWIASGLQDLLAPKTKLGAVGSAPAQ